VQRRSFLKGAGIVTVAVVLPERAAAISEVSVTRGRADLNLNENAIEASPKVSAAIEAEPSGGPSERPAHQHRTVLGAPSNLGLKPSSSGQEPGVQYMAQVLREHGLVSRLHAKDAGTVIPPKYESTIDPSTKIRNVATIREYSIQLAGRLGSLLDEGRFP
jgi:hypothetical protein